MATINLNKAYMGLRVHVSQWLSDIRFEELMSVITRHRALADEISFFSSSIHPAIPLETVKERMAILKSRIAAVRRAGFRPGINFLSTLGHADEFLDEALKGDYTPITGIDGKTAGGSFCPNDGHYRAYLKEVYLAVAQADPDFIWLDDDIRMDNHAPVGKGCFCDNCLRRFNAAQNQEYTRQTLVAAFDAGSKEEKRALRQAWQEFLADTICDLLKFITATVHSVRPDIQLGEMTGEHYYEGYHYGRHAEAIASPASGPAMWRPGGGFYSDESLNGIIAKSAAIGRHIAVMPGEVVNIQSEIENFPYQLLKKSCFSTVLETAAYMAVGCTGAAYNIIEMMDQSNADHESLIARLAEARPFYDLLARTLGRSPLVGVWAAWKNDIITINNLDGGAWLEGWDFCQGFTKCPQELGELGLPMTYSPEHANVVLLSGFSLPAFSKSELEKILTGGVYADGDAVKALETAGLSSMAGFKYQSRQDKNSVEYLSDDAINGEHAGTRRDCVQAFWPNPCAVFSPIDDAARILGYRGVRRLGDVEKNSPCMGLYENRQGGRFAAAGYSPWTYLQSRPKSEQIKRIFRWLSKDTLPAYVESYHKVHLWVRDLGGGKMAAVLLNSSFDPAEKLSLLARASSGKVEVIAQDCSSKVVIKAGDDGVYSRFVLPVLPSWNMVIILF